MCVSSKVEGCGQVFVFASLSVQVSVQLSTIFTKSVSRCRTNYYMHDGIITWKAFVHYWSFVRISDAKL